MAKGGYEIDLARKKDLICHKPLETTSSGLWNGDPLKASLTLFLMQISLMMATTQLVYFVLKPLKQPRVLCEIVAGIILGPSVFGRSKLWSQTIFPRAAEKTLRIIGCLGDAMFLFLMGVKMDPSLIFRTGKKPIAIATAGTFVPLALSAATAFGVSSTIPTAIAKGPFLIFVPAILSITSFPNTAQFLTEIDLLNSELGQIALASSLINDYIGWVILTIFTAIDQAQKSPLTTLYALATLLGMVLFLVFILRPWTKHIIRKVPKEGQVKDSYVLLILLGAIFISFFSDFIGASISLGPLAMGLVIPGGPPLGSALVERAEMLVMEIFLPMFYVLAGMKADISVLLEFRKWASLVLVVIMIHLGKMVAVTMASYFCNMYLRSAFLVALIMCYKGLIELMHLVNWWNGGLLSEQAFTIMVLATCGITIIVSPILQKLYDPFKSCISYSSLGTIQHTKPNTEIRVLVCVHNEEPVRAVINLLESMNATETNPMCVYVLQLVELVGQAIPILTSHKIGDRDDIVDPVLRAFVNYEQRMNECVVVQPFTTVSPYKTMHQDVCRLAGDKNVAFTIVPFKRKEAPDALVSKADQAIRNMIPILIANAPCSVGILLHEGNCTDMHAFGSRTHHVAVIFWGGPDDREALALASRMASMERVSISVLRFLQPDNRGEDETQRRMDDDSIVEFQTRNITYPAADVDVHGRVSNVSMTETVVRDQAETIQSIRSLGAMYDLLLVGRQPQTLSEGLVDWSDFPELGVFGDMFATLDTATSTCPVLVVQQR